MKTIYIDIDEEITGVIDRIRQITDHEIVLVIPQRALILQSLVNLKLLKNQGDILGRKIIIVTADQLGRHLAARSGLEVREKVGDHAILSMKIEAPAQSRSSAAPQRAEEISPRGNYEAVGAVSVVDIVRRARSSHLYPIEESKPKFSVPRSRASALRSYFKRSRFRRRREKYPRVRRRSRCGRVKISSFSAKVGLGFIGFSCLLIILIIFLVLPKATVNLLMKTEPLSQNVNILVRADIKEADQLTGAVPGEIITLEKQESQIFKATGKKTISEKAQGEVTLSNELGVSQLLVATTRLMSKNNILFRTQNAVTVPPASVSASGEIIPGTVKVKVIASEPGPAGNIGPSDFYIVAFPEERREKIYGRSTEAISGGASKEVSVVTEQDLEAAKKSIAENLVNIAREEIKAEAGGNREILDSTMQSEVVDAKSSKAAGEEADTFGLTVKVQLKALVFFPPQVRELALNSISNLINSNQYIPDLSQEGITFNLESIDLVGKRALLNVHINKELAWKIDQKEIKKQIGGKKAEEALEYFNGRDEIQKAEIRLWPFWVKKIPDIEKKIEINILTRDAASE